MMPKKKKWTERYSICKQPSFKTRLHSLEALARQTLQLHALC